MSSQRSLTFSTLLTAITVHCERCMNLQFTLNMYAKFYDTNLSLEKVLYPASVTLMEKRLQHQLEKGHKLHVKEVTLRKE